MIEMLFVDADCRGLGYGSMLLDFAKANGATRVDVNQQNPSALLFYISKGFHIIGLDDTDEAEDPIQYCISLYDGAWPCVLSIIFHE